MEVPVATLEYLEFAKSNGERPVLFNHVPHIFYRGIIDISEVQAIGI